MAGRLPRECQSEYIRPCVALRHIGNGLRLGSIGLAFTLAGTETLELV